VVLLLLLMVEAALLIVETVGRTMGCACLLASFLGVLVRWLTEGGRKGGRAGLGKGEAGRLALASSWLGRKAVAGLFVMW
jgi:hypothetical protein